MVTDQHHHILVGTLFANVCTFLSVVTDKWSPALQIRTVLLSIQALLSAPNPDDPLANDVADAWKKNETAAIITGMSLFVWKLKKHMKARSYYLWV